MDLLSTEVLLRIRPLFMYDLVERHSISKRFFGLNLFPFVLLIKTGYNSFLRVYTINLLKINFESIRQVVLL